MTRLFLSCATAALLLVGCSTLPDTVGEAAPVGAVWVLQDVDDVPVAYSATVQLYPNGRVTGSGPCNRFEGRQDAPLPWVEFTDISLTKRACPDLAAEAAFLSLLQAMDFAEIAEKNMLLTNAEGRAMFFVAR